MNKHLDQPNPDRAKQGSAPSQGIGIGVDSALVQRFSHFFRETPSIEPFDFCSAAPHGLFPPAAAEGVLDYFFFCCAHQFGFWTMADARYERPMTARLDGASYKGSDYLWKCATRLWSIDPSAFAPKRMLVVSDAEWDGVFADDTGSNPLPMWAEHLEIIKAYTTWFSQHNTSPGELVRKANEADQSLASFLLSAGNIPGYAEDPLRKKLLLLAIVLENRPEHFLAVNDPEAYQPIIDYHLQRSALRTGLVKISDADLHDRLTGRLEVSADEEEQIRSATYRAIQQVVRASGSSVAAIDYFFFTNRTRCPEMSAPLCNTCPVQGFCAQHKDLFQPVFRTAAY